MSNKKTIYFLITIGLMFSSVLGWSQSSMNYKPKMVAYEMKSEKETMAYKSKIVSKITDFYNYLELISDPNIETKVRAHTALLVKKMFLNDVVIVDFLSKKNKTILLEEMLSKVMLSHKKIQFKISNSAVYLNGDEKTLTYNLAVTQKSKEKTFKLNHRYFINVATKRFGEYNKEVVLINLAEISE